MKKPLETATLASMYMAILQVPWYRPGKRHRLITEYNQAAKAYRIKRQNVEAYIAEKYPEAYQEIQNNKTKK